MQRIQTRTQLINFICRTIRQRSIVRACHEGEVRVLGGFIRIHPSTRPGWVVQVTSRFGHSWLVAVTSYDHQHIVKTWLTRDIPWQYYTGRTDRGKYSIYDGDDPKQADLARRNDVKNNDRVRSMCHTPNLLHPVKQTGDNMGRTFLSDRTEIDP